MVDTPKKTNKPTSHTITMIDRNKLTTTAVNEVVSAQDSNIIVKTEGGMMQISGNALRVQRLSLDEKILDVVGNIVGIKYFGSGVKKGFFAKLFK